MELQAYLERLISVTHCPITFAGDVPKALSRWLLRSIEADPNAAWGTEPYLDTAARLLMFNELVLLPAETIESNWRLYIADMTERFQEVNTPKKLFTAGENKFMYGLNNVYCDEEQDILVNVITYLPTPVRLWINGELVVTSSHDYLSKDYFFMYRFREGNNVILIECPLGLKAPVTYQEFIVKLNPIDHLNGKPSKFIDDDLYEYHKRTHSIFFEKAHYALGEPLQFVVLPRYFHGSGERLRIRVSDEQGVLLSELEAMASENITVHLDGRVAGVVHVRAESINGSQAAGEAHAYVGDFAEHVKEKLLKAATRSDCDEGILTTVREISKLSDSFKSLNQYVPNDVYETVFPVVKKFSQYLQTPDRPAKRTHQEIFGSNYTVFEQKQTEDALIAYTVYLPDHYDASAKYPLVVYFHDAQARFFPVDLPWIKRTSTSEAIIVNMVGIGRLNYVDDLHVIRLISKIVSSYNVDRDSVHAIGFCTGGPKTYRIASQIPDAFAAISGIIGDMRLSINEPEYEQLDNFSNMAVIGMLSTENWFFNSARKMGFLKRVPNAQTHSFHGFMHNEFNSLLNSKKLLEKLVRHKREMYPASVKLSALEPGYNKSYWVKVDFIEDLHRPSRIYADKRSGDLLEIEADNIKVFSLLLNRAAMGLGSLVKLSVNGMQQEIALDDYTQIQVTVDDGSLGIEAAQLSKEAFEEAYQSIRVDEERTGIKQVYMKACTLVKPQKRPDSTRGFANKLAYLLQNPIKDRYMYYKYEACSEADFDWKQPGTRNFVLMIDARSKTPKQQELLDALRLQLNADGMAYEGKTFSGPYFAFIKCKHPLFEQRYLLVVAYNNDDLESEVISFMNSFDMNRLFYNDAVVFHGNTYHGYRTLQTFLNKGEDGYEPKYVEEYC